MSVSVTRIDGQNVGLRLLGQTSVQVLTLDLTTGEVGSNYLTLIDLANLEQFAIRLLPTVPVSARSAAAIGLLSRLCAISPADAATVSLSASVVSGVATLTASITASPATLIMTLPYAPSGGIMPSSGGSSSPSPPTPGSDGSTISVLRGESLSIGDCVSTQTGAALKCSPSDTAKMPCVGIVERAVDPDNAANCIVRCAGLLLGLGGLTPGVVYFAGAGGSLVSTPPSTSGDRVQAVGFSVSSTALAVALSGVVSVR
jgi:hypothetical protein